MLPNSSMVLVILGASAVGGVALGFCVDWIIAKIRRARRTSESRLAGAQRQTGPAIAEDTDHPSSEQALNESELAADYRQETATEEGDDDWLNNGVAEVSTKDVKSDDERWLNVDDAEVEEIPPDLYKQRDEEWLNAGSDVPLEPLDELLTDRTRANRPQIQFRQDGSRLDINVSFPRQPDTTSGQTTFNVRIGLPSHLSARRAEGIYDLEITTDDLSARYEGLQDVTTIRPVQESTDQGRPAVDREVAGLLESPIGQTPLRIDSLPTSPVESRVAAESRALLDEITVRPVESPVAATPPLLDSLAVGPAGAHMVETHPLMDEITVKPVQGPLAETAGLLDSMSVTSAESPVAESRPLMDEITIRPSPGPIEIEYDLIDDLITKRTSRTRIASPAADTVAATPSVSPATATQPSDEPAVIDQTGVSGEATPPAGETAIDRPLEGATQTTQASTNAAMTRPAKSSDQKAEAIEPVSITEITEFLKEKRSPEQGRIPSVAPDSRSATLEAPAARRVETPSTRAEGISVSAELRRAAIKALAALRIYNHSEFYVQDTDLTSSDASIQGPEIGGFTLKVLNTPAELDELISGGYDLAMNIRRLKRGLKKGMVALLVLADKELASMGWACVTEGSKSAFKGYPYNRDLDKEACVVGEWTNPRFLDSDAATLARNKRQQLLRDKGFIFERSVADAGMARNNDPTEKPNGYQTNYRRRTYNNLSLPGLFGMETWREDSLDGADNKLRYHMTTLLVLVLPLPPKEGDSAREYSV